MKCPLFQSVGLVCTLTDEQNEKTESFFLFSSVLRSTWRYQNYRQTLVMLQHDQKKTEIRKNQNTLHIYNLMKAVDGGDERAGVEIFRFQTSTRNIVQLSWLKRGHSSPLFQFLNWIFTSLTPHLNTISLEEIEFLGDEKNKQQTTLKCFFRGKFFYCFTLGINLVSSCVSRLVL